MKKLVAMMLCGTLVLSVAGCGSSTTETNTDAAENTTTEEKADTAAEEEAPAEDAADENPFEEHVTITMGWGTIDEAIEEDEFVAWMEEKFNCDIQFVAVDSDEQAALLINSEQMPDFLNMYDFTVTDYADQGLISALPEGWEEKYPNMAAMVNTSGVREAYQVDGVDYVVPNGIFNLWRQYPEGVPTHRHIYFRKDWAEEVGMPDLGKDYMISESEIYAYIDAVKEAGLSDNNYLAGDSGFLRHCAHYMTGVNTNAFVDTGSEWVWTASTPEYKNVIKKIRELYETGYVDPDFYVQSNGYYENMFFTGGVAIFAGASPSAGWSYSSLFEESTGLDFLEDVGQAQLVTDDGYAYIGGVDNCCNASFFSPDIDEAVFERILSIIDWACTYDGQYSMGFGIQGVHWDYTDDGVTVTILDENKPKSCETLNWLAYCGDDRAFAPIENNTTPAKAIEMYDEMFGLFEKLGDKGEVFATNAQYTAFHSEAKDNYSVNYTSKAIEVAVSDEDIDTAWDAFVEEQRGIWEPVVNDLNAEYYGN